MKLTYLYCAVALSMLSLSACDFVGKNSDALIKVADNVKSANNNGIDANNNTGINISSPTLNVAPKVETTVKILDKYNVPMVDVNRIDITLYKKSLSDCVVTRLSKKYNNEGGLISEESEVSKPIVQSTKISIVEWIIGLFILANTVLLIIFFKKLK